MQSWLDRMLAAHEVLGQVWQTDGEAQGCNEGNAPSFEECEEDLLEKRAR